MATVWYVVAKAPEDEVNHFFGTGLRQTLCGWHMRDVAEPQTHGVVDCIACIVMCPNTMRGPPVYIQSSRHPGWYGPYPFQL